MKTYRLYTGKDGQSHFEEVPLKFEARNDRSETAELIPGSGIIVRRFEPTRSNPWHHAPGRYAVFTLSGAVTSRTRLGSPVWNCCCSSAAALVDGADGSVNPPELRCPAALMPYAAASTKKSAATPSTRRGARIPRSASLVSTASPPVQVISAKLAAVS